MPKSLKENRKPPIGLIPHPLWIEKRIIELANAIVVYTREDKLADQVVNDWAKELAALTDGELL